MGSKFGTRLRELRGNQSQSEVAPLFGVKQVAYGNWERGEKEPNMQTLTKIAEHYQCSVDWLLGREHTGTRIRKAREAMGISVKELAVKMQQSDEFVMRWENGISEPTERSLSGLAEVLGVTYEYLKQGKPMPSSAPCESQQKVNACESCAVKDRTISQLTETVASLTRQLEGTRKGKKQ